MKKLIALSVFLMFFAFLPSANADSVVIVSEAPHRQIDGKFIDDDLANSLSYNGRLGQLVFNPPKGNNTWNVDAQLIDDVVAMERGYKLVNGAEGLGKLTAQIWLRQLKSATLNDPVFALAYGNPSQYWIHRLSPHNESYFLNVGATRLTEFFGREIKPLNAYLNTKYFGLDALTIYTFNEAQRVIQSTASYMDPVELENIHSRIASVLNPDLSKKMRSLLDLDLKTNTDFINQKIRLSSGKFTVSSRKQNLPITISNDFLGKANVSLIVSALNERVQVGAIPKVEVPGKSKVQILVPVEVIAPGDSALSISIKSSNGDLLGTSLLYPLTLRVISPVATWITTGAAVTLFLSALIQSVRRLRRRRK